MARAEAGVPPRGAEAGAGPGRARGEAARHETALRAPSGRYDPGPAPRRRPRPGPRSRVCGPAPLTPAAASRMPRRCLGAGFAARTAPAVPPRHVGVGLWVVAAGRGRAGGRGTRGPRREWGPRGGCEGEETDLGDRGQARGRAGSGRGGPPAGRTSGGPGSSRSPFPAQPSASDRRCGPRRDGHT